MGAARAEIENTIHKYAYLFDENDAGRMGECFTVDGVFAASPEDVVGREAVNADMTRKRAAPHYQDGTRPMHVNSNVFIIEEDDQKAEVQTYWQLFRISPAGDILLHLHGAYRDTFVNQGGQWLIKRRATTRYSKF